MEIMPTPEETSHTGLVLDVENEIVRMLPDGFHVHDGDTAAWVVRRIVAAREYGQRVKEWAEIERRRAATEEDRLLYLFGSQLRDWVQTEIATVGGRRKSIALPGGTIGFRSNAARLLFDDELAVLAWAKTSCQSAVVTTERLLRTPVNDHFEQTGEVPPGVTVRPAETVFFIR